MEGGGHQHAACCENSPTFVWVGLSGSTPATRVLVRRVAFVAFGRGDAGAKEVAGEEAAAANRRWADVGLAAAIGVVPAVCEVRFARVGRERASIVSASD